MAVSLRMRLQQEQAELTTEAQRVYEAVESEGRTLTDGERARDDEINARLGVIGQDLAREEQHRARLSTAPAVSPVSVVRDRAEDRPYGYAIYGMGEDEFVRRHPTSLVSSHPKHPRNVYQDAAFGEFLVEVYQAARNPYDVPVRLRAAASGMNEGVPSEGGHLVQTTFSSRLLERTYQTGRILQRMQPDPVGPAANGIAVPAPDESSRADGSRWGGVRAYWAAEAATLTASRPKFTKFRLDLEKLVVLSQVTDEMLADVPYLGSLLGRIVPQEIAFKLEDGIVNGSGAGAPLGILNAGCLVEVSKETGQAAKTILAENIVNMYARLFEGAQTSAVWLINQDVLPQLFTLSMAIGTGGAPLFMPEGGLSGNPYNTLFGLPVLKVEYCQTLGTRGDIVLADFGGYSLIDKDGIQQAASLHVYFVTDEQAFRFVYRVNGAPWAAKALTPKNGTNTVSSFVALATRS